MERVRIGLVGAGFMGRCHALAFRTAAGVFRLPAEPVLELIADADGEGAARAANALGFRRATSSWRALVEDPEVDVVDIAAPNALHAPIAVAAIAAGKAVYCEKPLAGDARTAGAMADAADIAGTRTMVGFNYLKNPIVALAREIARSGEIGEITGFRGIHAEDFMSDPARPFSWRLERNGGGVLADLGSHIVALARHLVGDVEAVAGDAATAVAARPAAAGSRERRRVEVEDHARFLVRFASGARGTIEANWVATGRKMHLACELNGTKGSLVFNQERLNELRLYAAGQPAGREGFKTIVAGPAHAPYGDFLPAPGHQLGFNELKAIEARDLVVGVAGGEAPWPDFREGWHVQRVLDAVRRSAAEERWIAIGEA